MPAFSLFPLSLPPSHRPPPSKRRRLPLSKRGRHPLPSTRERQHASIFFARHLLLLKVPSLFAYHDLLHRTTVFFSCHHHPVPSKTHCLCTISPLKADGLKYYDLVEGNGPMAEKGSIVQVHFDCLYPGITAVSSRESKLLAGNRSIAQPYEFKVGAPPGKERKHEFVDNPNGLFSAQAAPKPLPAMYTVVQGIRVGGKVWTEGNE